MNKFVITHKGRTAFLLRKSEILKKAKMKQKEYKADLSVLDRFNYYYNEGEDYDDKNQAKRYTDAIEMEEEEKHS